MERLMSSHLVKLTVFLLFSPMAVLHAQSSDIPMADTFRAEGKIYVVVAVMLVIFSGLISYLIYVDRKVSKLEKDVKEQEK